MKKNNENDDVSDLLDLLQGSSKSGQTALDPAYLFDTALRFRWLLIVPFCLAMLVGIYLAVKLPRAYEADTLILVEQQQVPDSYVHSIVGSDIDSRITTIQQQILSRTNLMNIIERFNLFSEAKYTDAFLDDKIEDMRKRISVKVIEDADKKTGANAFRISFRGEDPNQVYQVVNTLTTYVIDQNLKLRETHAVGTSEFLDDELIKMRQHLEEVEKALKDFRAAYMGELPEQLPSNLMVLDRLQQQVSEKQLSLRDQQNRLMVVENQLKFVQQSSVPTVGPAVAGGEPSTLEELKQRLATYRTKYTDNHPDVMRLKDQIEELEKEAPPASGAAAATAPAPKATTGIESDLMMQRGQALSNIKNIESELTQIKAQIDFYQQRVENTPKREQELISLKRDYDNIQKTYSSVLTRKLEADIAVNMEKKQKGEQFRIIDPARRPNKPISPDMRVIFLGCLLAGLAVGGGLVFVLEFFDNSVKKSATFQNRMGISVLMVMPVIESQTRRNLRRLNNGFSACAVAVSIVLVVCLAAVTVADLPSIAARIRTLPLLG